MSEKTDVNMVKVGCKKERQEAFVITEKKLKSLLFEAYEYGANEGWRFKEWVAEQIDDFLKPDSTLRLKGRTVIFNER